jgi:hypothetical protein
MTSRLLVDKIEGKSTSGTIQMPEGHVIQTQTLSRVRTGTTSGSSTSAVILNDGVGNFELAITPKFATSKIVGSVSICGVVSTTSSKSIAVLVYRNGSFLQYLDSHLSYFTGSGAGDRHHFGASFVDSPNSTSTQTYSFYGQGNGGSYIYFDVHVSESVTNSIILQEIAQ